MEKEFTSTVKIVQNFKEITVESGRSDMNVETIIVIDDEEVYHEIIPMTNLYKIKDQHPVHRFIEMINPYNKGKGIKELVVNELYRVLSQAKPIAD